MRIRDVRIRPWTRPLRTPLGGLRERRGFLLRLESDGGFAGWGEASPAPWVGGESPERAAAALALVAGAVRRDPAAERLESFDPGCPSARLALATALLDLRARESGRSVAELLGARPTTLELAALLPDAPPGALRAAAVEMVGRGFRRLKLKVGGPVAEDVERLRAVRDGARGAAIVRLDANRRWTEAEASAALAAMAGPDVELVEEPLREPAPEALARLRRRTGVPIALDETIAGETELEPFLGAGAASFLVVKLTRIGSPSGALRLAARAAAGGLAPIVTDSIESPVGRAMAAHFAAALPGPRAAVGLGGAFLLEDEPPAPQYEVTGPGLGIGIGNEHDA